MAIRFHPHALERMFERGATEAEVLETIREGRASQARQGRRRYDLDFKYQALWQYRYYGFKHLEVYAVEEASDIIVITVVVKYG